MYRFILILGIFLAGCGSSTGQPESAAPQSTEVTRARLTRVFKDSGQSMGVEQTMSVVLYDMDDDADLDLVEGANLVSPTRIWLNNGHGYFGSSPSVSLGGNNTHAVAVGDLDRDGRADILEANNGQTSIVWRNDGFGSFTAHNLPAGGNYTWAAALADLDEDEDLDLIVGARIFENQSTPAGLSFVHVATLTNAAGVEPHIAGLAVGDTDHLGRLDIVAANQEGEHNLHWSNHGAFSFGAPTEIGSTASNSSSAALADLDGDTWLDLVIGNYPGGDEVYHNSAGNFSLVQTLPDTHTFSLAVGDIIGDPRPDLVCGVFNATSVVYANEGGLFVPVQNLPTPSKTRSLTLGDLDGDLKLDLVQGNFGEPNKVYWRL